jgi:hypothetical protein
MATAARRVWLLAAEHVVNSQVGTSLVGATRVHLYRALATIGTSAGGRISTGRGGRWEREWRETRAAAAFF